MPDALTSCVEEEFSFCASWLWRRRSGWRPALLALRGPGEIPFPLSALLSILGVWRFVRKPLRLNTVNEPIRGATVTATSALIGSYGMGGPGFCGFRLQPKRGHARWVVFPIWGAGGWLTIGESLVADAYFPDEQQELAGVWTFKPLSDLVGMKLIEARVQADGAEFEFAGQSWPLILRLRRDSHRLPNHRGSGEPKVLDPSVDVRDAVLESRIARLWV